MKLKLILFFIALLIPALVFSQQSIQQEKIDDLIARTKQVRASAPNAERQSQRLQAESHLDFSSPMAKRELSRLLNRNAMENLLHRQSQRMIASYGHDNGKLSGVSRASLPMSERNNQKLTTAEKATIIPILEDFQVNDDHGTSSQYYPVIGVDDNGNFVVAWTDERSGWKSTDIYAQRFSSDGTAQGANFKVNEDSSNCWFETPAAMAMSRKGNFIVVWMDRRNGNSDIYGQRYNPDGETLGENFKINDDDNWQESPSVAMDDNGNFVVVWQSNRTDDSDIYAQRYAATGEKLGDNFRVNDDSDASSQYIPAIAMSCNGDFVVVWIDERNGNWDIYGQRYSASGAKQGENFRVNDDSDSNSQVDPAVDMDSNGNFVVTWSDDRNGNWDIFAQRFVASGVKLGADFRVNSDNSDSTQGASAIALDGNGDFIVAWTDGRNGNWDIYAQLFDNQGTMLGTNYRVNNDSGAKEQLIPKVKMVNGYIYYTWVDNRIESQGYDIFARVDRFSTSAIPVADRVKGVPAKYALYPNYPNPFNPTTTISYALPQAVHVQVQIFDLNGREVKKLVDRVCSAGVHSVVWNGTDEAQQKVSSGIYICRFNAGEVVLNRKLILAK